MELAFLTTMVQGKQHRNWRGFWGPDVLKRYGDGKLNTVQRIEISMFRS